MPYSCFPAGGLLQSMAVGVGLYLVGGNMGPRRLLVTSTMASQVNSAIPVAPYVTIPVAKPPQFKGPSSFFSYGSH
jgi:hypothetical protein